MVACTAPTATQESGLQPTSEPSIQEVTGASPTQPAPETLPGTPTEAGAGAPPANTPLPTEPAVVTATPLPPASPTPLPSPAPTPAPPERPLAGIETALDHNLAQMSVMQQAGSKWVRRNGLLWSLVEAQEGTYNWNTVTSLERELQDASSQDLEMILIVRGTPVWAQQYTGKHCGPIRPEKLEAFGRFMNKAVTRYSAPPFNVKYWEIWNEPDVSRTLVRGSTQYGCWGDKGQPYFGGEYYGELLKTIYPQIKAANPDAQLLVGGLLLDCDPNNPPDRSPGSGEYKDCSPATFLQGILEAGAGDSFDGVSFHAYDFYFGELGKYGNSNWNNTWDGIGPILIPKTAYLKDVLAQYGYEDKYLLNTEVALLCGRSGKEGPCQSNDYQNSKSYYLAQAYAAAQAAGLRANIWFSLYGWRASQLVYRNLAPYPAYQAFQFSASQLAEAAYLGEVNEYPGVRGYKFARNGGQIWLIWSHDGQSHRIDLPSPPAAVYDVYGNSLPPDQAQEVDLAPRYIHWDP